LVNEERPEGSYNYKFDAVESESINSFNRQKIGNYLDTKRSFI